MIGLDLALGADLDILSLETMIVAFSEKPVVLGHSPKVQTNSVCIHYISLLRGMSNYDKGSNDDLDLEHTS